MKTIKVFADMIVNISTPVEGSLPDWPRSLQDKVYKEIEKRSLATGHKFHHWRSKCDVDGGVPFIHVIVYREVVVQ